MFFGFIFNVKFLIFFTKKEFQIIWIIEMEKWYHWLCGRASAIIQQNQIIIKYCPIITIIRSYRGVHFYKTWIQQQIIYPQQLIRQLEICMQQVLIKPILALMEVTSIYLILLHCHRSDLFDTIFKKKIKTFSKTYLFKDSFGANFSQWIIYYCYQWNWWVKFILFLWGELFLLYNFFKIFS